MDWKPRYVVVPSGNHPFIVDLPIKNGDFPVRKLLVYQRIMFIVRRCKLAIVIAIATIAETFSHLCGKSQKRCPHVCWIFQQLNFTLIQYK